jgi:tripartite-type tricarboxylate transporter receptor subunit TctC
MTYTIPTHSIPRLNAGRAIAAVCFAAVASVSQAQTAYPTKPVTVIVPFTPAGATDLVARLLADRLARDTGWQFVIDNRPGAGGNIGLQTVARSTPDGYMLGMGQTANIAINPSLYKKMPYDALKDLVPVALVAEQPLVLVVKADSPYRSVADLVEAAKANPGKVAMASSGTGTVGHLAGELFARRAGFTMLHVPYKGAAQALTDLIAGQTDYMFPTPQSALALLKGGKIRVLAVTAAKRVQLLPNVPTIAESGYQGFEAVDWKALVAPAGTPPAIIKRLHDATEKALSKPEMIAKLLEEGSKPMSGTLEQAKQLFKNEQARWGKVIQEAQIKLD